MGTYENSMLGNKRKVLWFHIEIIEKLAIVWGEEGVGGIVMGDEAFHGTFFFSNTLISKCYCLPHQNVN